jgi:ACT domain-containing protein
LSSLDNAELEVELRDSPGELVRVLMVLAQERANVVTVVHDRAHVVRGTVPVRIQVQVDPERLGAIAERLRDLGIGVRGIGLERDLGKRVVIVVGHVFRSDIKDTMDTVREPGTIIRTIDARLEDPAQVSTVKLVLQGSPERLESSMVLLAAVCERKGLLMMEEAI